MIQKIGCYLNIDTDGCVVPDVAADKIQSHWQALINEIIDFTEQQHDPNIISLYVRGSVPRGFAIDNLSDLDLIFVSKEKIKQLPESTLQFKTDLLQRHSFCRGIEWSVWCLDDMNDIIPGQDQSKLVILLKTQALHMWGQDIVFNRPKIKAGINIMSHLFYFEKEWADYSANPTEIEKYHLWMGKRILRTAFELSMLHKPRFTRDLYWCYAGASDVYPDMEHKLYAVLELTLQKTSKEDSILSTFSPVAEFIINQIKSTSLLPCATNSSTNTN